MVRADETLESIARARYGAADHAGTIARANPLADPARMRPGRTLRLPRDPANIQGQPAQPSPRPPMAEDLERRHVVRPGDSLSKISLELYGSTRYASHIFDANRRSLRDEHSLRPGQTLRIPPKPREPGRT
jgi:nucleoid-associated protein YgaU